MKSLVLIMVVIGMLYLIATLIAALRKVWFGGVDQTEEFLRSGVDHEGLWEGHVPPQESGSMITVREGIRLSSKKGEMRLTPTSTISRDLY
jgi:hypothetical protein